MVDLDTASEMLDCEDGPRVEMSLEFVQAVISELRVARQIVEALADTDAPIDPGSGECRLCFQFSNGPEWERDSEGRPHMPDCAWLMARKLTEKD